MKNISSHQDTIVALSTPPGEGALALIRISGKQTIPIVNAIFTSKDLTKVSSHQAIFGKIQGTDNQLIDEVILTLFRNPRSFTGEDSIEISCHGSPYIVQQIMQLLLAKGARLAAAGEFTQRAFLNGKMDLAQAEAVADLIAANSEASHRVALTQMRGGISEEIKTLRQQLLDFTSLIELELDFGEEDVEFADRSQLIDLVQKALTLTQNLASTFQFGNALKNGIPVVIAGKPNAGKSTLLNALLGEEKAIVSDIPGTTRDFIEDELVIDGIRFRFVDTAGLRETEDKVEKIGVERTQAKIQEAQILLYLYDTTTSEQAEAYAEVSKYQQQLPDTQVLLVANKIDAFARLDFFPPTDFKSPIIPISAQEKTGLDELKKRLRESVIEKPTSDVVVTNVRHYHSLKEAGEALIQVQKGLQSGISGDLLSLDIREALRHLGSITGEVTTDEILGNIFSKFCIGK